MAGVYIKGMEMPKIGETLTIYPDGKVIRFNSYTGETVRIKGEAVPVPQHGDLIDRDEVMKKLMKKHSSWFYEGDEVCESIKAALAVIPGDAEEAK